ncbi:MAG: bifunctional molybdenum cofactor biosynthesis protein MoaC/MoaB [Cyclobacteriaceae bacterium]
MNDITHKISTLRTATAIGMVMCNKEVIDLAKAEKLPKGDLFNIAKAAGFIGAKKTQDLIPHCHPVGIDAFQFQFFYYDDKALLEYVSKQEIKTGIYIVAHAKYVGKTGIEMEALTGVSVAALTIYDLLKPLGQKDIQISDIHLLEKKGGKSDKPKFSKHIHRAAILLCSDAISSGKKEDTVGQKVKSVLEEKETTIEGYKIVSSTPDAILGSIKEWVVKDIPVIFTIGGTGLGSPLIQVLEQEFDYEAKGVVQAMYQHGLDRSPLAMHSQLVAGYINETLIVTLPGSSNGSTECLQGIIKAVFHARVVLKKNR